MLTGCSSKAFSAVIVGSVVALATVTAALRGHLTFVLCRRRRQRDRADRAGLSAPAAGAGQASSGIFHPIPMFRVVLRCQQDATDLRKEELGFEPDLLPLGDGCVAALALMPDGITLCLAHPMVCEAIEDKSNSEVGEEGRSECRIVLGAGS